jgi:molybdopterin-guanine dinucleotide biosynthesis protein A
MSVTAIILAGGGSTRMGREKATIVLGGRTLLQRVIDAAAEVADETVVVCAPGRPLPAIEVHGSLRLTTDEVGGQGPLAGILAGLAVATGEVALLLACDQPFVRPALLRLLVAQAAEASAVIPLLDGQPQHLCAALRVDAAPTLREAYEGGSRAAAAISDLPGTRLLDPAAWRAVDADGVSFAGANTPEELARLETLAAHLG